MPDESTNGSILKTGVKTSEGLAGAGIAGLIALGDQVIPIPDVVMQNPVLVTLIILGKYAALAALAITWMITRSHLKEAATRR